MLVLPIRAQDAHLENGHTHHNQEQDEGFSRRPAHVLVTEGVFVNIQHQHLGLVARIAIGHHLDDVKDLEGGEHGHHADEQHGRSDEREGDPA